ncbi:nitroreductase family protein [Clostridium sp. D2Q-14]|uniref:nitroreductase family protein n=1 Tax=Anaeromonas gelatinilytica TaxID=2683194 RepID=UPI00193B309F|nr:nitroreductase family protein [Anaeromonas gelatinilytica]MBS4536671.1 nitroreductase family protein [Anaeromonas gelatinilytica]
MNNEVITVLKNHRSIRSFEKKKIEKEILDEILKVGIRAANGGNLQGYSLVVLDDLDKLEALGIYNIPLVIIALADAYRTKRWFNAFGENKASVNTTHGFFINNWDALICLHNISIAAESLGIGTYYNGDITSMDIGKVINNPEYTFPSGMLCLGYPKNEGRFLDRLPLEAVVHYNSYRIPTDEEIKGWYNEKENLFQTRNTKEKLEELRTKGIFNIAQAYSKNKFKKEELEKTSKNIKRNIKESGYDV